MDSLMLTVCKLESFCTRSHRPL